VTAGGGDERPPPGRGAFWRVVRLVAAVALFLYALRQLGPQPIGRLPLALIAGLLLAGAMAVTDSVVGLLAAAIETLQKDRQP
jgi:hypothetical protein